jgi:NCS1 family nucleobase:cation symporter-1
MASNFLLLLDYWITPWLAVILLDFYWLRKRDPAGFGGAKPWNWSGLLAYGIGLAASVPFMQHFIEGPFRSWFGGADLSYFIGFAAAGIAYALLAQRLRRTAPQN